MNALFRSGAAALVAVAGSALIPAQLARADVVTRIALLTGSQVVPPVASPAVGAGYFLIDTQTNTVNYWVSCSGLAGPELFSNIHGNAPPGAIGPVRTPLAIGTSKVGVWNYPEPQEFEILNGLTYVSVHSAQMPGGELRGQLVTHVALYDGMQMMPPSGSAAQGIGLFTIDTNLDTLSYYILTLGLGSPEVAAQIYGPANYTLIGGPVLPLPPGSPKVGMWNYPPGLEPFLLDGLMYSVIHTAAMPAGEIRGLIVASVSPTDGGQEVPPILGPGGGYILAAVDTAGMAMGIDMAYGPTMGPEVASNLHGFAPMGAIAPPLIGLPIGPRKLIILPIAGLMPQLFSELTYIEVVTAAVPTGEMRGQIRFPCSLTLPTQPATATVRSGSPASLAVVPAGNPPYTFLWQRNGIPLVNGGNINGVTTPVLTFTPAMMADSGTYDVVVGNMCGTVLSNPAVLTVICYPNCDNSTLAPILNVNDFLCFMNQYAAGASYANCDNSTIPPVLNVNDFQCFINEYAIGCP